MALVLPAIGVCKRSIAIDPLLVELSLVLFAVREGQLALPVPHVGLEAPVVNAAVPVAELSFSVLDPIRVVALELLAVCPRFHSVTVLPAFFPHSVVHPPVRVVELASALFLAIDKLSLIFLAVRPSFHPNTVGLVVFPRSLVFATILLGADSVPLSFVIDEATLEALAIKPRHETIFVVHHIVVPAPLIHLATRPHVGATAFALTPRIAPALPATVVLLHLFLLDFDRDWALDWSWLLLALRDCHGLPLLLGRLLVLLHRGDAAIVELVL